MASASAGTLRRASVGHASSRHEKCGCSSACACACCRGNGRRRRAGATASAAKHVSTGQSAHVACAVGATDVASGAAVVEVPPPATRMAVVPRASAVDTEMEPAVGTETIRIKMKAYFSKPLNYACEKIQEIVSDTGATMKGPIMLPTKRKIWCVLRSPHVNKDSREHFEMRTHTRFIDIVGPSAATVDQLMALQMPAGVGVTIKLL